MPPTLYHRHGMTMCGVLNWSGVFQVISRVPQEMETSFNEEASLQAARDTCHYATGRRARDVVSFAENGLGPPPIEGFVSPDSLLHRLSAELYSVIYPSISTWEAIRGRMTANEAEWSLPLSEELPEGLSDESAGRVAREVSSKAIPSTSGSRHIPRVNRSWKAMSFFSKIRQHDIDRIRRRYQIPDDVVLRIPDSDEKARCLKYEGDVAFYEADLRAGLRFPVQPFVREVNSNGEKDLTVDKFLFCYEPVQITLSGGFWTFKNRDANSRVVQGLPSSNRIWKHGYFFVYGDNWEKLPQEDPRDFVGVRRSWGTPSSSALDRLLLNSVWQEKILRILDIEDRRYNIFIKPDLFATFSLGPVPSSSVRALVKANKKRVDTMKLNKSRLKQLAQLGEVAVAPVSLKRKKPDEGSSRRAEEPPTRPTVQDAAPVIQTVPPMVMVDVDTTPPSNPSLATINQSPHVAMDRAKGALTSRDIDDYATAHTEDLQYLMVHSVMRGLKEAVVMSQRCIAAEEGLATLRAKYMADEAEMKNAKRAVMELTRERKDALAEVEKLKKELKARDDDVKAAVDAKDKAVADFKHLVGQIEGAKEAAVYEFRASEVFKDINTRYFLSGFEAFRKQAVQHASLVWTSLLFNHMTTRT
uniref:Uncharacterized protein n=1 Tax=Fagus sylvatica TaxID=28930 RepID=A0A2N9GDQ1_FAGSY